MDVNTRIYKIRKIISGIDAKSLLGNNYVDVYFRDVYFVYMKKKKDTSPMLPAIEKPKPNRTGIAFTAYFPEDLMGAWDTYLNSLDPKPSKKSLIEFAMREFLKTKGFWPPPPPSDE